MSAITPPEYLTGEGSFQDGLSLLQEHIPAWWPKEDESSRLFAVLSAIGAQLDDLSAAFEQIFDDRVLARSSLEGLQRTWEPAWGLEDEQLPQVQAQLIPYILARMAEDGSASSLLNTLMAIITATPANTQIGTVTAFSTTVNLIANSTFEADAVGSLPVNWPNGGGSVNIPVSGTADNAQAHSGQRSMKIITDSSFASEGARALQPETYRTGVTYTLGVWLKGAAGGEVLTVWLGTAADKATHDYTLTTGWQRCSVSWTPLSDLTSVQVIVRTKTATAVTFWMDDVALIAGTDLDSLGLLLPADGSGLTLWQWDGASFPQPSPGLFFPGSGAGVPFPYPPVETLTDNVMAGDHTVGMTSYTAYPLIFAINGFVSVIEKFSAYSYQVQVKSELAFDRGAFARAVARYRPAHCLPPTILEVP